MSKTDLKTIKNFIFNLESSQEIVIRGNELIKQPLKTAKGLIALLEKNKGKIAYLPYDKTLKLIYKKLKYEFNT